MSNIQKLSEKYLKYFKEEKENLLDKIKKISKIIEKICDNISKEQTKRQQLEIMLKKM